MTDKTALLARVEIAMHDCYMRHPDNRLTTTLLHDLAAAAVEALAAPAGGGQGEAVKWERRVVNKKTGSIHYDWCACSQAEFDVGSTEGSTLRVEYRTLYTTPPSKKVKP